LAAIGLESTTYPQFRVKIVLYERTRNWDFANFLKLLYFATWYIVPFGSQIKDLTTLIK
jgi:hypothetical protein